MIIPASKKKNLKIWILSIFLWTSYILNAKVNVGIEVMHQFSNGFAWKSGVNLEIPLGIDFIFLPDCHIRYVIYVIDTANH